MTDFVPFLPSLIMCMHKAPQPHYWQTAWPVYAPQRQLAPRIPALIKESDGAITFSILSLSLSPIRTSEWDKHGTESVVRNINSAININTDKHKAKYQAMLC